jgi:hypothetical protein
LPFFQSLKYIVPLTAFNAPDLDHSALLKTINVHSAKFSGVVKLVAFIFVFLYEMMVKLFYALSMLLAF